MLENKFKEIIDYAIEREKEAAVFYKDLQAKVKYDSTKQMFAELERMELSHIDYLQQVKPSDIKNFKSQAILDLKISDYFVEIELQDDLTYQQAIAIAMKREDMSKNLYAKLASQSENADITNLFNKLAEEEAKHKNMLETIYDDEILKEN